VIAHLESNQEEESHQVQGAASFKDKEDGNICKLKHSKYLNELNKMHKFLSIACVLKLIYIFTNQMFVIIMK